MLNQRLSLLGKVVVLKTLAASQLVYILSPLQTNHEAIKELNSIFFQFFYGMKKETKLNAK